MPWASRSSRSPTQLNTEGLRPPNRAVRFHKDIVGRLVRKHVPGDRTPGDPRGAGLGRDEWFVIDLAAKLGIGKSTLHAWLQRGWVRYRRLPGYRGRCVCWADAGELERLGQVGPDATGLVGPAAAVGIDHAEAPSVESHGPGE